MDVGGSGDITNRVDNVLAVHRCNEKETQELGCDAIVDIFKNRFSGQQDIEIQLNFRNDCKRFYMPSEPKGYEFNLGWVNSNSFGHEVETPVDCPF